MHGLTRGGNGGVCPAKRSGKRPRGERTGGGFHGDLRNGRARRTYMRETLLKNGLNRPPIHWIKVFTAYTIWPETCLSGRKQSMPAGSCWLLAVGIWATRV